LAAVGQGSFSVRGETRERPRSYRAFSARGLPELDRASVPMKRFSRFSRRRTRKRAFPAMSRGRDTTRPAVPRFARDSATLKVYSGGGERWETACPCDAASRDRSIEDRYFRAAILAAMLNHSRRRQISDCRLVVCTFRASMHPCAAYFPYVRVRARFNIIIE